MRFLLPFLCAALLARVATAQPMWEVADRWVCDSASHLKMSVDGSDIRVNEEKNRQTYDFRAGTVTTGFTGTAGRIGWTRYTKSRWGGFNVIEILWDGESYPLIVTEDDGEWWVTSASGWNNDSRTIWIVNYRCRPQPEG